MHVFDVNRKRRIQQATIVNIDAIKLALVVNILTNSQNCE